MFEAYRSSTILGLFLIAVGVMLVVLPFLARHIPPLERLPWILVYVYRRGNFYFVTSPILIIAGLAYLVYIAWRLSK